MKYVNSLKYIDSFKCAGDGADISARRISELCLSLGNINRGIRFIHVPESVAGHGCAVLMEGILKNAGQTVGRIIASELVNSRSAVYVNGEIPSIDDYSKCVSEVRSKIGRNYNSDYLREEAAFVLSLLLCQLGGCRFVILEGTDKLDRVCAPYELTIIPSIYNCDEAMEKAAEMCDAVKCGAREVISGNQKSDVYNYISNVCAPSGQRLFIPVKSQFTVTENSSRRLGFNYNGREGFALKTPSLIMRDCAMTVIEAVMAMRREGVRIPVSSIIEGMYEAGNAGSFEVISYTPTVIADNSCDADEVLLMYKTFCEVFGENRRFSVCLSAETADEAEKMLSKLPWQDVQRIVLCGHNYGIKEINGKQTDVCRTYKDAFGIVAADKNFDSTWFCFGNKLSQHIKEEIEKHINI